MNNNDTLGLGYYVIQAGFMVTTLIIVTFASICAVLSILNQLPS
ncbi:MAG: hypothetical protein WCK31_02195 [bacterium]